LKELQLQVAIVSNGRRGDRLGEAAGFLDARGLVRLALAPGRNELFIAMHRPVTPGLDLDSVCSWVPRIKESNPTVRVGFSYIIVWGGASRSGEPIFENIHEIGMAARRAKDCGFDYV